MSELSQYYLPPEENTFITKIETQGLIENALNQVNRPIRYGGGDQVYKVTSKGLQIGDGDFDSAPFRVTMAGAMTATSATITGVITATSGTIGGFDIGSDYIRDVANSFGLASTITGGDDVRFWAGATFASRATAATRIYESGAAVFTSAVINGSPVTNNDSFGSGVDGAFVLDGTNTYATYFSKSGSDYTQLMDVYATDITLSGTATVNTAGYRLLANGTTTIGASCVIKRNGSNGTSGTNASGITGAAGGTGGTALASGSIFGSAAGADGGAGGNAGVAGANGSAGTGGTTSGSTPNSFLLGAYSGNGITGGAGGNGGATSGPFTGGSGGGGGGSGTITNSVIRPYTATFAIPLLDFVSGASPAFLRYAPGVGGSGGGGGGASGKANPSIGNGGAGGGGAGSGSNGGMIMIAARILINNGSIQAVGGNGGNGGNGFTGQDTQFGDAGGGGGGGSGGRGGSGGAIVLIYSSFTGAGTVSVAGGTGGTGGTGGAAGVGGSFNGVAGVSGGVGTTGPTGVIIQMAV